MQSNVRVAKAFTAVKGLGVPEEKVRRVLEKLLKLYDNNWELIEEESYQVLADAIFEYEENKGKEANKRGSRLLEDSGTPLKKRHLEQHEDHVSPLVGSSSSLSVGTSSRRPKSDNNVPQTSPSLCERRSKAKLVSPETCVRDKGREPVSSLQTCTRQKTVGDNRSESNSASPLSNGRAVSERVPSGVCFKKAEVEPGIATFPKHRQYDALIKPKSDPFADDDPQFKVPISVIHPPSHPAGNTDLVPMGDEADGLEPMSHQYADGEDGDGIPITGSKTGTGLELANITEASPNFEIASSLLGEVKIYLSCNSAIGRPNFRMPSLGVVLKMVEDRFVKSYKIINPNFSLVKLMEELCQCFLELGTESTDNKQEELINITPTLDLLKKSDMHDVLGARVDHLQNFHMPGSSLNRSISFRSIPVLDNLRHNIRPNQNVTGETSGQSKKRKDVKRSESLNSHSLVVVQQHQFTVDDVRPHHNVNDISKGEERVKISLVNEITSETYPPLFYYIPHNMVYQNAYINFSLDRIGDEDCCSNCFGDCLSSPIPCACARETRGEFAYTLEGLVKKELLDECISMSRDSQKHRLFYCKDCPLERSKNDDTPDPCKGHLVKKFIKECWSKCGCNKQCGNRVVQRGITCKLQVFFTPEGKGWGLRTLENLPRGTFVCEYVGEIVTNTELYERNLRSTGNERHTYPVLLDADWGSEGVLKDEEALCLDATYYGNVARFINHRCYDANLVEIPVEIETPDHHYYHIAFFTTRKIYALEELTWDYMIDFADVDHPIKAFRCHCGSKSCRDMKHIN